MDFGDPNSVFGGWNSIRSFDKVKDNIEQII